MLKEQGKSSIFGFASFIVGYPGETRAMFWETLDFVNKSSIDYFNIKIFYYDHNTPIAQQADTYALKGKGMHWSHSTMGSSTAFDLAEEFILSVQSACYIPQHSGEIWEVGYLHHHGFNDSEVKAFYGACGSLIKRQLMGRERSAAHETQLFDNLVRLCDSRHERCVTSNESQPTLQPSAVL